LTVVVPTVGVEFLGGFPVGVGFFFATLLVEVDTEFEICFGEILVGRFGRDGGGDFVGGFQVFAFGAFGYPVADGGDVVVGAEFYGA